MDSAVDASDLPPVDASGFRLLHLDPGLGIGNFARKTLAVSHDPDLAVLHCTEDCVLAEEETHRSLSVAQLVSLAERWASWYVHEGIGPYDVVAVYARDGLSQILQLCALSHVGAIAAITNGAMSPSVAERHFQRLRVKRVVGDAERLATLPDTLDVQRSAYEAVALPHVSGGPEPFQHSYSDPVMITHSSGTTGTPKAVTLAHGQWFHGIRDNMVRQDGKTGGRRLLALPASHNSSIAFIIHGILAGSQLLVLPTQDGDTAVNEIERFKPDTVAAFPVTHVRLALHHAGSRDFSSVEYWVNSGDAAHEKHVRRLVSQGHRTSGGRRAPGSVFVDGLGSSELGHISFPIQHTSHSEHYGRCVGRPHEWVDARIFGDRGETLPDGVVGRLGVKSPSITPGYWNDSELTARSRIGDYFLTGDLCYRDSTGRYFHVDRVTDVINTADGPVYSLLTEEYLMLQDEIVDDCCVCPITTPGGPDRAVAVVWSERGASLVAAPLLEAFRDALANDGKPPVHAVAVVLSDTVPRGITGKVLKRVLAGQFREADGDLSDASWLLDYCCDD